MNEKNSDAPISPGASASEGSAVSTDEAIDSSSDNPLEFGTLCGESPIQTARNALPAEIGIFGTIKLPSGAILSGPDLVERNILISDEELERLRKLQETVDGISRLIGVDLDPDMPGASLAAAVGKVYGECSRLRAIEREAIAALDMTPLAIRVREGGAMEDVGKSIAVSMAKLSRECERLRDQLAPGDHSEFLKRIPRVRPDLVTDLASLPVEQLIRRCLTQADWLAAHAEALDGLDLRVDGRLIPGSGVDKCRMPRDIRGIVERLLNAIKLKDEVLEATTIEKERLYGLINSPQIADFMEAIKLEAIHQRERWGSDHDAGKSDVDWLFLAGYLGGKAVEAGKMVELLSVAEDIDNPDPAKTNRERRLHHIVAAGAAILNWHAQRIGVEISATRMRPGIMPPLDGSAGSGTQLVQNAIDAGLTKAAYHASDSEQRAAQLDAAAATGDVEHFTKVVEDMARDDESKGDQS